MARIPRQNFRTGWRTSEIAPRFRKNLPLPYFSFFRIRAIDHESVRLFPLPIDRERPRRFKIAASIALWPSP